MGVWGGCGCGIQRALDGEAAEGEGEAYGVLYSAMLVWLTERMDMVFWRCGGE